MTYPIKMLLSLAFLVASSICHGEEGPKKELFAKIETSEGAVKIKLFHELAPTTVSNFVSLARKGFYKNQIVHKIIANSVVVMGDPTASAEGGPGYIFDDEFHKDLLFDKPGIVAMANAGVKNSNGSQFQITLVEKPFWHRKFSVFGEVVQGLDVVKKISLKKWHSKRREFPAEKVVLKKVTIEGDWYEPIAFKKTVQFSSKQLQALTAVMAKKLLEENAKLLGLGTLESFRMTKSQTLGYKSQVGYKAQFSDSKNAKIILLGDIKENQFVLNTFQFNRGKSLEKNKEK